MPVLVFVVVHEKVTASLAEFCQLAFLVCVHVDCRLCRWHELKQQYDLRSQDAKLLSANLKQSSHGQQLDEINQLEATVGR